MKSWCVHGQSILWVTSRCFRMVRQIELMVPFNCHPELCQHAYVSAFIIRIDNLILFWCWRSLWSFWIKLFLNGICSLLNIPEGNHWICFLIYGSTKVINNLHCIISGVPWIKTKILCKCTKKQNNPRVWIGNWSNNLVELGTTCNFCTFSVPDRAVPLPFLSITLLFVGVLPCTLGTISLVPRHHPFRSSPRFHTPSGHFFFLGTTILCTLARFSCHPSCSFPISLALLGSSSMSWHHLLCTSCVYHKLVPFLAHFSFHYPRHFPSSSSCPSQYLLFLG